jgi:hypothetical protein
MQNPIQSKVTPQFSLPSNLESTLQVPDIPNVNMSETLINIQYQHQSRSNLMGLTTMRIEFPFW